MSENKYFYVICRDGQIIEVENKADNFQAVMNAMVNKGIAVIKNRSVVFNGVDVSKVLSEEQYENYLASVNPRLYIKNGTWYDGKEKQLVKHESWKQKEIDQTAKLEQPDDVEVSEETRKRIEQFFKNNKPKFMS